MATKYSTIELYPLMLVWRSINRLFQRYFIGDSKKLSDPEVTLRISAPTWYPSLQKYPSKKIPSQNSIDGTTLYQTPWEWHRVWAMISRHTTGTLPKSIYRLSKKNSWCYPTIHTTERRKSLDTFQRWPKILKHTLCHLTTYHILDRLR